MHKKVVKIIVCFNKILNVSLWLKTKYYCITKDSEGDFFMEITSIKAGKTIFDKLTGATENM